LRPSRLRGAAPWNLNFLQQFEQEGSLGEPRMRQHQVPIFETNVVVEQEVEIGDARPPTIRRTAPEPALYLLERCEQLSRWQNRREPRDGVHERCLRHNPPRRRAPNRRYAPHPSRTSESVKRSHDVNARVSDIRSDRDVRDDAHLYREFPR
jgi:hypothetical protein